MDDAMQALGCERRQGVVTLKGRNFRISEPPPRPASLLLTHLVTHLGPWIVRVLGGQVTRFEEPKCPACGSGKAEQVNGKRWLCQAPNDQGNPCTTIWPRETLTDDQGNPCRLTLAVAMSDPGWRALFALKVGESIDAMDPEEAHALAMRLILSGTEYEPVAGQWVKIGEERTLDMALAQAKIGGMGIGRLAKAHLEVWALPSLVDDWTDTSPASSASATNGGSEIQEQEPPQSAPAGRAPPRTRKRKG